MTMTDLLDGAVREAFTPLRHSPDTPQAEIDAVMGRRALEGAGRRRRAGRLATTGALGAVIAGITLAALPSRPEDRAGGLSATQLLRTAAAAAADEPAPAPFTGFRYVKTINRMTWATSTALVTAERPEEEWLSVEGHGTRIGGRGYIVSRAGDPDVAERIAQTVTPLLAAETGHHAVYDRVPLRDLPTDPDELRALLEAALRDGRWSEGHSRFAPIGPHADDVVRYTLASQVVMLLSEANASPPLRAALFGVLARIEGFASLGRVHDPLGREGDGVEIRFATAADPPDTSLSGDNARAPATLRVIFDSQTSDILSWSINRPAELTTSSPSTAREIHDLLAESHTYVATGHVDNDGQRPAAP
jgi:hypothetical protein